jgi:hypothetical protein
MTVAVPQEVRHDHAAGLPPPRLRRHAGRRVLRHVRDGPSTIGHSIGRNTVARDTAGSGAITPSAGARCAIGLGAIGAGAIGAGTVGGPGRDRTAPLPSCGLWRHAGRRVLRHLRDGRTAGDGSGDGHRPVAQRPVAQRSFAQRSFAQRSFTQCPFAQCPVAQRAVTQRPVCTVRPVGPDRPVHGALPRQRVDQHRQPPVAARVGPHVHQQQHSTHPARSGPRRRAPGAPGRPGERAAARPAGS